MIRSVILLLGATVLAAASHGAEPVLRPNVIVVLADDLGWGDLSCYEGTIAETPHLDKMAAEGVRFTQCYVAAPICSPSRCGIVTGQFPARWRITSYLQTRAGNTACEMSDYLDPAAPSLPRTLKQAGYATAHVGKWHLGGGRDVMDPPKFAEYGYDVGLGTWESPEPHPDLTAKNWIWSAEDPVKRWDRTQWMVDQTLRFLKNNDDRPCFVNLWLDDTHTPWVPSAEDQVVGKQGRASGKGDTIERLRGVLAATDRQIGRLLDALRKQTERPTVVIFLGDNGPAPTFDQGRTGGLRGAKLSLYEGGIRVPGMVWGPGLVRSGITNSETVLATVDLFPSLCSLCRVELPSGYESDGEDLTAALLGQAQLRRRKPLFWEYGRNDQSFAYPSQAGHRSPNVAVREGKWKLLIQADGTKAELFDLETDAKETNDLVRTQPEIVNRLSRQALKWRKSLP
jgi:arylsulfatase A-like enzyme